MNGYVWGSKPLRGIGSGLVGVGRDDALLLVFLVGFLGGQLFGGFYGVFDGVFGGGAVDLYAHVVLAAAFFALVEDSLYFEAYFAVVFLAPVDELALEVPVGVGHGVDVEVEVDNLVDDDAAGEVVAFFKVDGAHKGFEGVAVDGFEDALRLAVVLYQLREAYLLGQSVEVGAADEFGAHLGQESFALGGVFLVEEFGHYGAQHGVAQVFEPLVVDAAAFAHIEGFGLVDEGNLVELGVARYEPQHVLEEEVEFFVFAPVTEKTQHVQYLRKARQALWPPKPKALLRAKSTRRGVGLLNEKSRAGMSGSSVK